MSVLLHILLALGIVAPVPSQNARQPPAPAVELSRLSKALVGEYTVLERHHATPRNATEWSITGSARYRPGPDGLSIVEEYESNNPRGPFTAIAILWWDPRLGAFKHFECETGEPCGVVDDVGRWEGETVVFVRDLERQGTKYRFEARYDVSKAPAEVTYSTIVRPEGAAPITTMTVSYKRRQ